MSSLTNKTKRLNISWLLEIKKIISATISVILLLTFQTSYSQQFSYRHIGLKEGLPDLRIRDLIKDSRGFYWIGTEAGLVKLYDNQIKVYDTDKGLPSLNISAIAEDGNGDLLIGMPGTGIGRFDGKKFIIEIPSDSLPGSRINRIHYSAQWDLVIIGTDKGFSVIKQNGYQSFSPIPLKESSQHIMIFSFLDTEDFIYVQSYNNGLFRYFPQNDSVVLSPAADKRLNFTTSSFITKTGDTIWALAYQDKLIRTGEHGTTLLDCTAEIAAFAEDGKGNIYMAGIEGPFSDFGGLLRMRNDSIELVNPAYGLPANRVNRVIFDERDNVIVISDQNQGIYILYPKIFQNEFDGLPPSSGLNIKSFATTKDSTLWVLDQNDLYFKKPGNKFEKFDRRLLISKYEEFKTNIFPFKYSYLLDREGSPERYEMLRERGRYPWKNPYLIYNQNETVVIDEYLMFSPEHYRYLDSRAPDDLRYLAEAPDGSLWLLSNVGFFQIQDDKVVWFIDYFSVTDQRFVVHDSNTLLMSTSQKVVFVNTEEHGREKFIDPPSPANITGMVKTAHGTLISCLNNGLYVVEEDSLQLINDKNAGLLTSITSMSENHRGELLTGTSNSSIRIIRFENNGVKIIKTIDTPGVITGNNIRWLETDNSGFLWAGTNLGITRIDLERIYKSEPLEALFYNEEDGFFEPAVSASARDKEGNIWLGGKGTVTLIHTKTAGSLTPGQRSLFVSRIDLDNRPTDWEELCETDPWTGVPVCGPALKYYHNNLSFFFNTKNISGHDKTQFRHRISGLSDEWTPFDPSNQVIYNNLPPGKYLLEVEAQLINNKDSRGKAEFAFRIMSPWWQRWWFYSILVLVLILVFRLVLMFRIKNIRRKETRKLIQEREMSDLHIKALQAQMNPHFIFNAINSIQYYILNKEREQAFQIISILSKLIRQTFEFASKTSVSIKEEISFLENYIKLEMMRFEYRFSYRIDCDNSLNSHKYHIPAMLLQPIVENAILHGLLHKSGEGILTIRFQQAEKSILKCIVEDNGIGRKKSAEINRGRPRQHLSLGLDISKRRIDLMNEPGLSNYRIEITDLYDSTNAPSGTRVLLVIPLISD